MHKAKEKFPNLFNVRIPYKDYEISLAADGSNSEVDGGNRTRPIFSTPGTDGHAIKTCIDFIDWFTSEEANK